MNILELKDIIHKYLEEKVLDIKSLSIEKGRIYAFVGPNGSGKTTLLSIMSLILKPTMGKIFFKGESISDNNIHVRRQITMLFQNPYLFNGCVAKNIEYGLKARGIPKKRREEGVKNSLEMVGLIGFEGRKAKELSSGQIQLVALARAIALEPLVLFLDEPTANVDLENTRRFENLISQINIKMGTTIVLTTHNLSQAYRLTEKVFSIFKGSLIPNTIHNLFSGKIRMTDKGPCFDTGRIQIWVQPFTCAHKEITHLVIDPEDVLVSKEPFASSARNSIKGAITKIAFQGGKILLEVNAMETFKVMITEKSLNEMNLNVGSDVYLTFKASSVHSL